MQFLRDIRYWRVGSALSLFSIFTIAAFVVAFTINILSVAIWKPVPQDSENRFVFISYSNPEKSIQRQGVWYSDIVDWRSHQNTLSMSAAYYQGTVVLSNETQSERLSGGYVEPAFFSIIDVAPLIGRAFHESDADPNRGLSVVLGERVWRDLFAADEAVVGQSIRVNGSSATILGVMPESFEFPFGQEIWLPLQWRSSEVSYTDLYAVWLLGVMKGGVTTAEVEAELGLTVSQLASRSPDAHNGVVPKVVRYHQLLRLLTDQPTSVLLLSSIALISICIVNAFNLFLMHYNERSAEIAMRRVLGCSSNGIFAMILKDTNWFVVIGLVVGLVLAGFCLARIDAFIAYALPVPFWWNFELNSVTAVVAVALVTVMWLVVSAASAFRLAGVNPYSTLRSNSRADQYAAGSRMATFLIVIQLALASGLVFVSGRLAVDARQVTMRDAGVAVDNVVYGRIALMGPAFDDSDRQKRFLRSLQSNLSRLDGIEQTAVAETVPGKVLADSWYVSTNVDGGWSDPVALLTLGISEQYFDLLQIPLLSGRAFALGDKEDGLPVAIVSETFQDRFFAGHDATGKTIRVGEDPTKLDLVQIVGVAADVLYADELAKPTAVVYRPAPQVSSRFWSIVLKSRSRLADIVPAVKETIFKLNRDIPLYLVETADEALMRRAGASNSIAIIGLLMCGLTVILAFAGSYGMLIRLIFRHKHELGARIALGATRSQIVSHVSSRALIISVPAIVAGWGISLLMLKGHVTAEHQDQGFLTLMSVSLGTSLVLIAASFAALAAHVLVRKYSPYQLLTDT